MCLTTSDWISLGSTVATLLGVVVAAVAIRAQILKVNEQLMLQHFADYTKRYQEIILHFPEDINEESFVLSSRADYAPTMRRMRAYFDLCFEEWYLNQRNFVDKDIWNVWKEGMRAAMSKPAFRQAWALIKKDSSFGVPFQNYIESFAGKVA